MTILAVTIGNTNVQLAIGSNEIVASYRIALFDKAFIEKFTEMIQTLTDTYQLTKAIVSSVNPDYTAKVVPIIKAACQKVELLTHESNWQVDYHRYEAGKLGLDRMLVCEAVYQRQTLPAIIFDFGTATTMNVLDKNGVFLGGAIFPGVDMGLKMLAEKTALLPAVLLDQKKPKLIGTSTQEAMQSASIYGNVAMVEGMVAKVVETGILKPHVYITGGAAALLEPYFTIDVTYEEKLILEGLLAMNK